MTAALSPSRQRTTAMPATPAHLAAPTLSPNAATVLAKRYLIKDANGVVAETAMDAYWRVASVIAAVDAHYALGAPDRVLEANALAYYTLMASRRFMPNSPTLMNAGRPLGQLSACFVLPVADALSNGQDGIYDTLRGMALIHQSGGGTGFSFSRLRAKGAQVRSTTGVASGPVSFMELYDASTNAVKQGGTRRGANMGILRCDHPDVLEFISAKQDLTKLTNFNISVGITDAFMAAVAADTTYALRDPATGAVTAEIAAKPVWDTLIHHAWTSGEPGIFFVDEANRYNPVPHLGAYEATNPCGEQPLLPYDVCNLGSLNVGAYVTDGAMDWDTFGRDVHTATRFLDNVIDANHYPLPEIQSLATRIRRIGLGLMGFADALIQLGLPYNSPEGVAFGRQLMAFMDEEAKVASEMLASQRGTFPEWERSIWGPNATCARDAVGARIRPMRALRNCNVTTLAPTGTISIFANCSGGMEPLFAVAFMRNQAGAMMPDVNGEFVRIAHAEGWHSDALMARIAKSGSIAQPEVPAKWQTVFVTANEIAPADHVAMQAAFQAHCDSAISKTTNFAHSATEADVRAVYELAYASRCKGVTVYRDGCRDAQVLSTGATATAAAARTGGETATPSAEMLALREALTEAEAIITTLRRSPSARPRPEILKATSIAVDTPQGTMFVNITEDEHGAPFEVFLSIGKVGGAVAADAEAIGKLLSVALRAGLGMPDLHKLLRGIGTDKPVGFGAKMVKSIPDGVGLAMERWHARRAGQVEMPLGATTHPSPSAHAITATSPFTQSARADTMANACPECSADVVHDGGCERCQNCDWSACG